MENKRSEQSAPTRDRQHTEPWTREHDEVLTDIMKDDVASEPLSVETASIVLKRSKDAVRRRWHTLRAKKKKVKRLIEPAIARDGAEDNCKIVVAEAQPRLTHKQYHISTWSVKQVGEWISDQPPFKAYCPSLQHRFAEQEVDGASLHPSLMTMCDLLDSFAITSFKHRKSMLAVIKQLYAE